MRQKRTTREKKTYYIVYNVNMTVQKINIGSSFEQYNDHVNDKQNNYNNHNIIKYFTIIHIMGSISVIFVVYHSYKSQSSYISYIRCDIHALTIYILQYMC